ncbi:MAG: hypothetical protein ACD_3C00037G0020 [uncultured bacterium (gcode 4)]|uniref:Uncharacterized protein n=1 Tax=uncultured bacterium (gcode 4) TaxID=1234023 RepID=K2GEI5_9BACT|nr:MAG: hypothetical protein ACD_3C00037G0020 [uncultured bacterium (gcode 4)]
MWISLTFAALAIVAYRHFLTKPRERKFYYFVHQDLLAKWVHRGDLKEMRKLKVTSGVLGLPLEFKIGFTFLGGYLFYGNVSSKTESAIVETFLGPGACEFLFATNTPRQCTVELLPKDDPRKPDARFPPHWWQKLWEKSSAISKK